MAKTKGRKPREAVASAEASRPHTAAIQGESSGRRASALGLAVALAAAHGLWSLFQWEQLVLARRGGDFFCGIGEAGGCSAVWDLPLATAIQGTTGLPVAGWGLVWSAVALAFPLWTLVRRARAHSLEPIWSAALLTALAGTLSILVLGGTSLASGEICDTCVVTYALVLAYAAVCLLASDRLWPAQLRRGALMAVGGTLVAFLVLLYPGLRTPGSSALERSEFLEAARASTPPESNHVEAPGMTAEVEAKPTPAAKEPDAPEEKPVQVARRSVPAPEPPAELERRPEAARLEELIARLSPKLKQDLSDALAAYARGDQVPLRPARRLIGSPTAPVRITEFTDVLCSHCAHLHETIGILREMLPEGSFALEPRQFPLDSECNPAVQMSSGNGVRCLAARAMICLEGDWLPFADSLFENQRWLTKNKIYKFAAPYMSRERLDDCMASPETEAKLRDDIAWALQHEIRGTPLVLVNGREVPASLQFLYAMVLAEADPKNPAFAVLPPSQPQARLR